MGRSRESEATAPTIDESDFRWYLRCLDRELRFLMAPKDWPPRVAFDEYLVETRGMRPADRVDALDAYVREVMDRPHAAGEARAAIATNPEKRTRGSR